MGKNFKVPVLFFLIMLLSKEVFSYDGEKVVILCILSFIIIVYFNFKDALYNSFVARSLKLKEEYTELVSTKENLEKEIRSFWRIFLDVEDKIIEIYIWVKNSISSSINKFNNNRKLISFHLIKDQLNLILKEHLKIKQTINLLVLTRVFNNLKIELKNTNNEKMDVYINKLVNVSIKSDVKHLILNKLNKNKELVNNLKPVNLNSFFYYNYA